ncbi:MAG: EF-P lysine aminoacylase GenX [Pseudomonadales bacterium]|nr:EF-P lysine aminoacylase GenX [Pseudomonadales bacterium]
MLRARAGMLRTIRDFFAERDVLEVVTPVLGGAGASDVHLQNVSAVDGPRTFFLQTSPEYAMKRLLAAGTGAIYQVGPVMRGGESGRRHNTEFTMLEWYRPGFDLPELAREVFDLLTLLATRHGQALAPASQVDYGQLFEARFGVSPHTAGLDALWHLVRTELPDGAAAHITDHGDEGTRNDLLDALFSTAIEPGLDGATFVFDFPASQASLSRVAQNERGELVSRRFELFWHGTELANGYLELRDAGELARRFEHNNTLRRVRDLPTVQADRKLLAALGHMPECCGVAMGLDRLLMLMTGAGSLDEVIAFSDPRL